jgi:hypothetical protein
MNLRLVCVALALLSTVPSMTAQTPTSNATAATAQVPRLVRFSGTVQNFTADMAGGGTVARDGASVPANVVGVTFSLYSEQTGGVALWSEVQNVQVDKTGHYTVQLGSTQPDGLPVELFNSAQAQWLGVQQERQAEQPRIMLVSVPYALKAADAETFGGKPPSAYASASPTQTNSTSGANLTAPGSGEAQNAGHSTPHPLPITGSGTTNYVPLWTNASTLSSSAIYQSSNNVGIGTTSPAAPLTVDGDNATTVLAVTQSGTAATAILGNNTATSGESIGVVGQAASATGTGIFGTNRATSGAAIGVEGESASPAGFAVYGVNNSTSGPGGGVEGKSSSSDGQGVFGLNIAESGIANGVAGETSSTSGVGVFGNATADTGFALGVQGTSSSTSGAGVVGSATARTGAAFGVKGTTASSAGVGVYGVATPTSGSNYGVEGTNASPTGVGVNGENTATTGNAIGVWGTTDSTAGTAVYGLAIDASNTGLADQPVGVWGTTNQAGGVGVAGTTDNAVAVSGANNSADNTTADFANDESTNVGSPVIVASGPHYEGVCLMDVSGDLACNGSKSAVVPVDGGTRQVALYAVEAPENWFEDAGSASLSHGAAIVHFEPTFAQTVNGSIEYHVFLTPNGDCKGLYVSNKGADGFEVHELGGGASNIAFDYRIMARRKGYEDVRLADNTERFNAIKLARQRAPVAPPHRASQPAPTVEAPVRKAEQARTPLSHPVQTPVGVKKEK